MSLPRECRATDTGVYCVKLLHHSPDSATSYTYRVQTDNNGVRSNLVAYRPVLFFRHRTGPLPINLYVIIL